MLNCASGTQDPSLLGAIHGLSSLGGPCQAFGCPRAAMSGVSGPCKCGEWKDQPPCPPQKEVSWCGGKYPACGSCMPTGCSLWCGKPNFPVLGTFRLALGIKACVGEC